ncbi:amphi-Trp domain-containing protein [Humidesulfovibrio mexicanus]|jgi:amphi-Trp domain-containing protein|uniref:Amphi-Trp domain-containing protein n=1 Tax=Humidesulfovibrio mexicanus TaxID=147047 RepID=A0A239A328_9BACT|nr:amphi-Trp domain-containing protein [Humidesulfovibrio mexicanus]SNR89899.1 amphi-Trp domain-containing protein [Humidesulfovibrio mexicanus]
MGYDQKFVFESIQDAESIRQYLEAVMEGLHKGRLVVSAGQEEFVLQPRELLTFAVKARKRGGAGRLSLTISWRCPEEETPKQGNTLKIEA